MKITKMVNVIIRVPMDFPSDWDDEMCEFHLNDSSWCWGNFLDDLNKASGENKCICLICKGEISHLIEPDDKFIIEQYKGKFRG